jgi:hypothetical protein
MEKRTTMQASSFFLVAQKKGVTMQTCFTKEKKKKCNAM